MSKSALSLHFTTFAETECKGSSELYEFLSLKIADDDDVLALCTEVRSGQPTPNSLFGAVHYLLLKGEDHPLKEYYPSLVKSPRKIDAECFVRFKDFCNVYRDEVVAIFKSKLIQTNEVRRCAYLYPIFSYVYSKAEKPLSVIEIGTSAGLQLLWDKFSYSYGTGEIYGDKNSSVHLTSEIKGKNTPFVPKNPPPVASKIGIDLHISDLANAEDYLWLKSLIWPEHEERLALFESAAQCFKKEPADLIEGDGVALLTDVVETLPEHAVICIFHTHVANQMLNNVKQELLEKVKTVGNERDVFHIYNNMWDRKLHLDYFIDGVEYNRTIGNTDGHGRWFEWNIN